MEDTFDALKAYREQLAINIKLKQVQRALLHIIRENCELEDIYIANLLTDEKEN